MRGLLGLLGCGDWLARGGGGEEDVHSLAHVVEGVVGVDVGFGVAGELLLLLGVVEELGDGVGVVVGFLVGVAGLDEDAGLGGDEFVLAADVGGDGGGAGGHCFVDGEADAFVGGGEKEDVALRDQLLGVVVGLRAEEADRELVVVAVAFQPG